MRCVSDDDDDVDNHLQDNAIRQAPKGATFSWQVVVEPLLAQRPLNKNVNAAPKGATFSWPFTLLAMPTARNVNWSEDRLNTQKAGSGARNAEAFSESLGPARRGPGQDA